MRKEEKIDPTGCWLMWQTRLPGLNVPGNQVGVAGGGFYGWRENLSWLVRALKAC